MAITLNANYPISREMGQKKRTENPAGSWWNVRFYSCKRKRSPFRIQRYNRIERDRKMKWKDVDHSYGKDLLLVLKVLAPLRVCPFNSYLFETEKEEQIHRSITLDTMFSKDSILGEHSGSGGLRTIRYSNNLRLKFEDIRPWDSNKI